MTVVVGSGRPSAVAAGRIRYAPFLVISRSVVMIRTVSILVGAWRSLGVTVCQILGLIFCLVPTCNFDDGRHTLFVAVVG